MLQEFCENLLTKSLWLHANNDSETFGNSLTLGISLIIFYPHKCYGLVTRGLMSEGLALGKGIYSQLGNMHWKVDEHLKYWINFPKRKYPWKYKIFQLYSDLENFLVYLIIFRSRLCLKYLKSPGLWKFLDI